MGKTVFGRKSLSSDEWRLPKFSEAMVLEKWSEDERVLIYETAMRLKPWIEYMMMCDEHGATGIPKPKDETANAYLHRVRGNPDEMDVGGMKETVYQTRILQAANELVKSWGWHFKPGGGRVWRWHKESLVEDHEPLPEIRLTATDPLFVP